MAQGAGIAVGSFTENFLQSYLQGQQLKAAREQKALAQKKFGLQFLTTLGGFLKMDPTVGKPLMEEALILVGIDPSGPQGKRFMKGFSGLSDEARANFAESLGRIKDLPQIQALIGSPGFKRELRKAPATTLQKVLTIGEKLLTQQGQQTDLSQVREALSPVIAQAQTGQQQPAGAGITRQAVGPPISGLDRANLLDQAADNMMRIIPQSKEGRQIIEGKIDDLRDRAKQIREDARRFADSDFGKIAFEVFGRRELGQLTREEASIVREIEKLDEAKQKAAIVTAKRKAELGFTAVGEEQKVIGRVRGELKARVSPADLKFLGLDPAKPMSQESLAVQGIVIPDTVTKRGLRQAEISTRTALNTASKIALMVEGRPELLGVAGFLARTVDSIRAGIRGLSNLFTPDRQISEDLLDPARYAAVLDRMALTIPAMRSAQIRSMVVSLAFSAAEASGQTGRAISDRDITRFIEEIGASTASPEQFVGVIRSFAMRTAENFSLAFEIATGAKKQLPLPIKGIEQMSASELNNLYKPLLTVEQLQQSLDRLRLLEPGTR